MYRERERDVPSRRCPQIIDAPLRGRARFVGGREFPYWHRCL